MKRSMSPATPRAKTTRDTKSPAERICGRSTDGSARATAAMAFMGCTGIGTSKTNAVARLYRPVIVRVVPMSSPERTVRPTAMGTKVPRSPTEPDASAHVKSRRSSRTRRRAHAAVSNIANARERRTRRRDARARVWRVWRSSVAAPGACTGEAKSCTGRAFWNRRGARSSR